MITTTQTDIEKRDEIFKDKEDIQYHITTILQRADYQRKVKKATKFPFNYITHYKTKRGNRYIIILTPTDKKRGGLSNPLLSIYTKLTAYEGEYMLRYDTLFEHVMIYTPHFFSRYRTRFLKDEKISAQEVIDLFAQRNFNVSWSKQECGERVGACKDGYIFIRTKDKGISVAVTFVSFDMLREEQLVDVGELVEIIKKHEDANLLA